MTLRRLIAALATRLFAESLEVPVVARVMKTSGSEDYLVTDVYLQPKDTALSKDEKPVPLMVVIECEGQIKP